MKRYEVDLYDVTNGATSPVDSIMAEDGYTAEMYIRDCEENGEKEWIEMLKKGVVTLVEID